MNGSTTSTNLLIADLQWRGCLAQSTDIKLLEEALSAGPISLYLGFDPTAPSLHIGNLVALVVLKRFQLAGHRPIPLVGGATGLIGDPSGRNQERTLNDESVVLEWVDRIKNQLIGFLDFTSQSNAAKMANNYEWTAPYSAITFLRDIGKHFSVNQMLSKESVSSRLESGGISYTEFSYQVLQALDYLELFRRENCILQIGGSDQWGNIVAGVDLIRRVESKQVHALTIPLLTKADGTKFGKTAAGSVWLDPEMTSPYALFQFFLNSDDRDVVQLLKFFSFKERNEIEALIAEHESNPGARVAHRALAREVTSYLHGEDISSRVEEAAKALFGGSDLEKLDYETLLAAIAELPQVEVAVNGSMTWVDLMASSSVLDSKSAARRVVKEGGANLNNRKISDENYVLTDEDFLFGRIALLRKGKRDLVAAIKKP
jgi:tyrosyl-tRNA synthetase